MSGLEPIAIGDVTDGKEACIRGTVRVAGNASLVAPISKRECVYYEVRPELRNPPEPAEEAEARDFVVEDESGRAFVMMERYEMTVAYKEWQDVVAVLDMDIETVSERLKELKYEVRGANAVRQRELTPIIRRSKEIATLLCAIRAHARGRSHIGKSLQEQRRFIEKESQRYEQTGAMWQLTSTYLERHDVVLQAGDRVHVSGWCRWEPDPDPTAAVVNYRERPMRLVVQAPPDGTLTVAVEGAAEQQRKIQEDFESHTVRALARKSRRSSRNGSGGSRVPSLIAVAAIIAAILWGLL